MDHKNWMLAWIKFYEKFFSIDIYNDFVKFYKEVGEWQKNEWVIPCVPDNILTIHRTLFGGAQDSSYFFTLANLTGELPVGKTVDDFLQPRQEPRNKSMTFFICDSESNLPANLAYSFRVLKEQQCLFLPVKAVIYCTDFWLGIQA